MPKSHKFKLKPKGKVPINDKSPNPADIPIKQAAIAARAKK